MGIAFAFLALIFWGIGDFLIQRSVRKFGDWIMIFYIDLIGVIMFTPFVFKTLIPTVRKPDDLVILLVASTVLLFAALVDFEALKNGKISVVEPIFAFEVPVTAILAYFFIQERITVPELSLILVLVVGIALVATKSWRHFRLKIEKGVLLAILTTIFMGTANFLFGFGGRQTDPWLINWFTSAFLALVSLIYILSKGQAGLILQDWRINKNLITQVSIYDNLAWLFFTFSILYIPIAIATGISESYIALAALLGLVFNGEKLARHQWLGLIICSIAAVILAIIV
ncbi:MAG: hypothetical protein A3G02_02180 [Candidatus Yanofskybacteria bacterium RIFCSPLOWO2_12_FULL_44_13b]|nr:MAG: hypothetical protein A3G02_02180 [Candidatus Yanofskybacteria bacterium RIFCSPLOWO2_12_FULL_44_13b]